MMHLTDLQATRKGKPDEGREALKAQMMVLHLRSRIQKELAMQVRHFKQYTPHSME